MTVRDTTAQQVRRARAIQVAAVVIALITAGAYLAVPIPFSPVPIVLQNMFVVFAGIALRPRWALAAVAVYLLLGAVGLPVFAGGAGGLGPLLGPTGGYLVSYPLAAFATAAIMRAGGSRTPREAPLAVLIGAIVVGFLAVYPLGVARLTMLLDGGVPRAVALGVVPFLPGDALKAVALVVLVRTVPASTWRSLN